MVTGKGKKWCDLVWHHAFLTLGDRGGRPGDKRGVGIGDEMGATVQEVVAQYFLV